MSPELKGALQDWLEDVALETVLVRRGGICHFLRQEFPYRVLIEFESLLAEEFGQDWIYPFGGQFVYETQAREERQHLNPLRLAWVRRKLSED